MLCYEGLYIGAAAVAKFYCLLVKDLVKTVVLGEVLADQRQERFSYVCQNTCVEWRIEPYYLSLP